MDTIFDEQFKEVKGLKWLPWVGSNYTKTENRILIIGESHYATDTPERIADFENILMTRLCVDDMGVKNNKYKVKFYQNLHLLLAKNKKIDTELFWSKVCYYNFIQKTMTDSKVRPNNNNFNEAASVFFNLLEKLKPDYCLMCGIGSINSIRNNIKNSSFKEISFEVFEKIGTSYPRILTLETSLGKKIPLIFIKHPSQYFSYDAWKQFMFNKTPEILTQFNDI